GTLVPISKSPLSLPMTFHTFAYTPNEPLLDAAQEYSFLFGIRDPLLSHGEAMPVQEFTEVLWSVAIGKKQSQLVARPEVDLLRVDRNRAIHLEREVSGNSQEFVTFDFPG